MTPASRHQHDTLDQIREHLEAIDQLLGFALNAADVAAPLTLDEALKQARRRNTAALAKFDALLAEGRIRYAFGPADALGRWIVPTFDTPNKQGDDWTRVLVIPLLVGVGCGNAKKDTP